MPISLMEGNTITTNTLISSIKNFNSDGKQHGSIKALLKNFILPETEMAIKENQNNGNKPIYTIPVKPPRPSMLERTRSIQDAKLAFLNSTVSPIELPNHKPAVEQHTLHYAQLMLTTDSEDTRSTGGGKQTRVMNVAETKRKDLYSTFDTSANIRKKSEQNHRKVSFKIKNASTSHKRPPLAKTMTINSNKVAELTKKFNNLQIEPHKETLKQSRAMKPFEDSQSNSRRSPHHSNSSTPSSTHSSSPNIKIVLRQRRGSKKRNNKKRCSSMDSIDNLLTSESSNKIHIIRSKSDGTKIPKASKKRLKYQDSNDQHSEADTVDGNPIKIKETDTMNDQRPVESIVVKNFVKKFECEIIAQSASKNTLNRQSDKLKNVAPIKEKPKVPEKKSSLVLTKNLVVKDGIPKIKTLKPISSDTITISNESPKVERLKEQSSEVKKKKEPIYDRRRYRTNYIHSEKLPLKVVEIIPEDVHEAKTVIKDSSSEQPESLTINFITSPDASNEVESYKNLSSPITPNESFLWRRKSNSQIYSDSDKSASDSVYNFVNVTINDDTVNCSNEPTVISVTKESLQTCESQVTITSTNQNSDKNMDFESNLVEACNKEIIVGYTSKPMKEEVEDYYEPLEPRDEENVVIIPVKTADVDTSTLKSSKKNCPLPEIPKDSTEIKTLDDKENIYQCLLEMRSHPEGDESSLHNYEMCDNRMEERTRGDGDSDDGYEYCKSPIKPYCHASSTGIKIAEDFRPYATNNNNKNYVISKSVSGTSTVSYEKIGSERIYEKIPAHQPKSKDSSPTYSSRNSFRSDYAGYNDNENIYDTIKHADGASLSHCYESIPNSPSMVKMRNNLRKQLVSTVHKRLSFDTVSNISQLTISSEQKTNSIYGQRSMISYNGQEIAFQVPSSETSVSDRSDRSDDWVDVSDEEKNEQKIIIVRERSRGRKSPISWSQKVRHQWQKSPRSSSKDKVSITSPTKLYFNTNTQSPYYSYNDDKARRVPPRDDTVNSVRLIHVLERTSWLNVRTILQDGDIEIQDLIAFFECDSSDSGHLYETLEPGPEHAASPAQAPLPSHPPPIPTEDDFDSFDSDTDEEQTDKPTRVTAPMLPASRLPSPPTSGQYTLTKIASAAQRKMRQIKRNLTKKYSEAMDGNPFAKSANTQSNNIYNEANKPKPSPVYANCEKSEPPYTNINFNDTRPVLNKTETPLAKVYGSLKEELKTVIMDKRASNGEIPPPLPEKPPPERPNKPPPEKPVTPPTESVKKDSGTLSRKAYFSFKSRFRRATSLAVDMNSEVPSALKITNSTFYLTDSMDGDSGFSNCSDNGQPGSTETLSPGSGSGARKRDGRRRLVESSPCLCPARPSLPPPPPPPLLAPESPPTPPALQTDFSAVNEELKRLLPTLSRKDKSPRARTSWYAECGADTPTNTSNTSWYAEAGLYPAGNISSSSGASSGSHPASPLPHSLFTHEPLYQFYNAAKVESVCRETGDSDSDAYEPGSQRSTASSASVASSNPPRPSAMALVAPRGPSRTLWCEVPEVLNSAVLSSLAPAQKRLQEAKFELLTSEASYLNSLNVLETNFIAHPAFRDPHIMPREDWETIFSTILPVRTCSQLLMNELEKCWQENILLQGICDIVREHAVKHFDVYVKYCENQALMVKALQRLQTKPAFVNALKKLESHPSCQSLSLHSFLMLPMQRVTRLPLLLDAVLKNLAAEDDEYHACARALVTLNTFVSQCNEGARSTERIEEMFRLAAAIEFPPAVREPPALGPACHSADRKPVRWLVRSGEMTHLVWKSDELKLTFGKKFSKIPLHLFLFNDWLVITKKKSEEQYVCVDHCPRSLLEVCASDAPAASGKHALLITLLENHEGRTVEMLMSCGSETAWSRWGEALLPPAGAAGEAVYAGWDCPQVAALYAYAPAQPDELPLAEGDVVNVTRKTHEGWYYGERTRDGEAGWFPGAYTAEIASAHVRARNLRQRYRLLALSGTYLGTFSHKKRHA